MVEGISEALLLPILARIAGGCLKESAVTVLNADGINFNAFLPLFGSEHLGIPIAILTDGDDKLRSGSPSAAASGLKAMENGIPNLRVEFGEITFEHELARSSALLPLMLDAFEILHPTNGKKLKTDIAGLANSEEKAEAFRVEFIRNNTLKGEYAQELAGLMEKKAGALTVKDVPQYIRNSFLHLGVVKSESENEPKN